LNRDALVSASAVLASYLLGGFCAAYYLVRVARSSDIRSLGSGNAGARNAGRILGAPGFVLTLLLDAAKGALAVLATARLAPGIWPATLALLAVVAGHIWPAQLGFRGGKGLATLLGGLAAWVPVAALGMASAVLPSLVAAIALPAMTLWAHRDNLAAARARRAAREAGR
jgi:glycerol-3-phosphate acyltransferase PlsY